MKETYKQKWAENVFQRKKKKKKKKMEENILDKKINSNYEILSKLGKGVNKIFPIQLIVIEKKL